MSVREKLSEEQVECYRNDGYVVVEDCVPPHIVSALRQEVARFQEEARGMTESNDRLDLEDSHTPEFPRVRRIKLPHTISDIVRELLYSDHVLAPARDLLGPDVRLHTTKLNLKSSGYGAPVEWHQDFAFYPHTNDDVLAIGVMIDDMREENGPLMVFPGSHRDPIYDHHNEGVFVGAMDFTASGLDMKNAVKLTAPAGSISIHHGRIVHGSATNVSDRDRRLLLFELIAADAFPVMGAMTKFDNIESFNDRMLCGLPTLEPRLQPIPVRIPQPQPDRNKSIYEVQAGVRQRAFEPAVN